LSPPHTSSLTPIKFRMETFWYWLTQIHLKKMAREREREREMKSIKISVHVPSVLQHFWLGNRKGIRPVKIIHWPSLEIKIHEVWFSMP